MHGKVYIYDVYGQVFTCISEYLQINVSILISIRVQVYIHSAYMHACIHACVRTYNQPTVNQSINQNACLHTYIHRFVHLFIYVCKPIEDSLDFLVGCRLRPESGRHLPGLLVPAGLIFRPGRGNARIRLTWMRRGLTKGASVKYRGPFKGALTGLT